MEAETLDDLVYDYETALEINSELDNNYLYAVDADFKRYSVYQGEMLDSLTVPFDDRVYERAFSILIKMWDSKENKLKMLYKGHDKQYYEDLRIKANEEIAKQEDKLEKAMLIEKYGSKLQQASEYFEMLEIIEKVQSGNIWEK